MQEYIIYIVGGLTALCFLLLIIEHIRLSIIKKRYNRLMKGLSEKTLRIY